MDTLRPDQVTAAIDTIHSRRTRGEYGEGNTYIVALPPDIRRNALVVIESAYLFLVQGKFGRALEALDSCCPPISTLQSESPEIVVGCLTLMHGYAITQCQCKLQTAWEEAVKVRKALLEPGLGFIIDPEDTITENLYATRTEDEKGKDVGSNFSRITVWVSQCLERIGGGGHCADEAL